MTYYRAGTKLKNYNGQYKTRAQHIKDEIAITAFWTLTIGLFFYCLFA